MIDIEAQAGDEPFNATTQLIYADWLQEQCREREAAFVRLVGDALEKRDGRYLWGVWRQTKPKLAMRLCAIGVGRTHLAIRIYYPHPRRPEWNFVDMGDDTTLAQIRFIEEDEIKELFPDLTGWSNEMTDLFRGGKIAKEPQRPYNPTGVNVLPPQPRPSSHRNEDVKRLTPTP